MKNICFKVPENGMRINAFLVTENESNVRVNEAYKNATTVTETKS
jgi:hypothetical protein